jgi:MOLPALP family lipoprotein
MKKILALLGSMGLVATSAMSVVACFGQNEQINQHQEISTLARERAKSLIIADQFGLDHQQVFNHLQNLTNAQTTSRYNEIFNETSINAFNINGKVGATGGILNQIINDNFQITDQTILDLIARMTNNSDNQAEKDRIKNTTGAEQISIILNTLATSVDSILGAGLGSVVGTVSGILPGFINADLISQITNISGKIKDVITNISQTSVQSILRALKNGSDLTTLQYYYEVLDENRFFTVAQMQAQMAFSLVNFFGYGIEKDYKEFVTINPSSPNTINYEGVSAKLFEFIKSGKISKFDFNLNLEKTVENLVRFVTILNTLLSLYRTPEIVYSSTGDYSQHLFSETETNDQFMTAINRKRIDTLNINLKGFNFGELIANLQYYLGGDQETGQYHFQKLIYILLSDGTFVGNSSLINLLLAGVAQVELGITNKTEVDSLRSIIGGNVIKRIVNNQRLRLKSIIDGKL